MLLILIKILIGAVVFYLIWFYLLPLITVAVIHTVVSVIVVIVAIVWLLSLVGISL